MAYDGVIMARAYSNDLRKRVIGYVARGHTKAEAAREFALGYKTVQRWCFRQEREGSHQSKPQGRKAGKGKIDKAKLQADVDTYPDATLKARGVRFGVSDVAILHALQRMKITFKKNAVIRRAG
jgi:transposase